MTSITSSQLNIGIKMKRVLLTNMMAIFCSLAVFAQTPPQRSCGTLDHHEYLKQTRKNYETDLNNYNVQIEQYLQARANDEALGKTAAGSPTVIPVVVHVVYANATQSISISQAASQVQVLNDDFAKLNADAVKVTQSFSVAAKGANIRFCLAQRDPNGNATTGVDYKSTTTASFSTDDKVKSAATGGADPWDVTKYINIWVCNLGSTLLGYGEFPTTSLSNTYGLVLHYKYTGSGGSAISPYNLGRTGTHEFGHCFNLLHIWGDDNGACTGSDQCADTPNQAAEHYGPFTAGSIQTDACTTTSPGVMWMNYMDYTDDNSMYMFTANQVARMEAVVSTSPWNVLQGSLGCTPVSALDAGITSVIAPVNGVSTCNNSVTPKVTLNNAGSTTLTSAKVLYKMDALATQTLNWSGSLASATSTVLTLNAYSGLTTGVHTFSVWVTAPNGGTDQNAANNSMSSTFTVATAAVGTGLPFTENFENATFPPTNWLLQKANTVDATTTWSRIANTTGLTAGSTAVARMDNYSSNSDITGQIDALRSPALTFTAANTSLNLTFDVSHRPYATSTYIDTLNVYISSDCGGTWTKLYTKGGAQLSTAVGTQTTAYTPTVNTQWRKETVSLAPYAGLSSVYVKFESRSGYGNNLYLDNINISYTTAASAPVASFSTASTKCAGSSIAFTDASSNTPTSWSWTFPGGSPSSSTSQNPSVTYTASGTYTATLISANASGTSTPVSQTITVNANPTVAASGTTICSGSTTALTASGASTYSWNTGASTASISVTPTITTNYTVTGTTAGCTNTKTLSVTVNTTPTVAITGTTICSGTSANLTASGATTYSWNTGASTASISVTPTTTTNYTVTGTSTGCSNTKTVSVTVNTTPTVSAGSTTICSGTSAGLTATGATTYSWNTGASTASISVTPTTTTNYTVTGTTTGCTDTKTLSVTVKTTPTVAANNATVCSGNPASITASGATTYSWNTGATTASISVTPTTTTNYTVVGTTLGCTNTKIVSVMVNNLPNVSVSSTTICSGSTGTLVASGAATYTWNTGATGPNLSVSPSSNTTYTVTGTSSAGCVKTNTASVTLGSAPSIAVNSATICSGSSTILSASGVSSYTWNTGANTATISVSPSSTSVYTVSGNLTGCGTTATSTVGVSVNTTPTVAVGNATICSGNTANLTASGATSYSWSTGATTASVSVTPTTTTNYVVTGTSVGCTNTKTVSVTVNNLPNVASTSATICAGSTGTITASGANTYTWNTGATGANLTVSPTSGTTYTVTGTSVAGCVKTATAFVNVTSAPSISVNSSTICSGSTTTLTASGVTSYSWNTGSTSPNISVNPTGTTVYTVTGYLSGCGTLATQTATVSVNALPNVTLGSIAGPLCTNNAAVTLSGSPSGGNFSGTGVVGSSFDPSVSGAGTFTVMYYYTDGNNCSSVDSKTVSVSLCTGINELSSSSISVYPNPAKDVVQISMSASLVSQATIEMYDAIGKLVISERVNNTITTLSLTDYAKGMYSIRVVSENNQSIIKLIRE